eukprot:3231759-Prymnesium_polylepis.1
MLEPPAPSAAPLIATAASSTPRDRVVPLEEPARPPAPPGILHDFLPRVHDLEDDSDDALTARAL